MTSPYIDETTPATTPQPALLIYRVSDDLVLAGQPQPEDWARLADAGFRVVVNMRSDPERAAQQQQAAEAAGLRYVFLPLPAYELEPEHLDEFHRLMQSLEGPVLLHCRTATRVALMWLLDRIVYDGWTQEQAEVALKAIGYDNDSLETFAFCADDYFERADVTKR